MWGEVIESLESVGAKFSVPLTGAGPWHAREYPKLKPVGVVEHLSDGVVIMYLGRIVEIVGTDGLFTEPNDPCTKTLLAETPRLETRKRRFAACQLNDDG